MLRRYLEKQINLKIYINYNINHNIDNVNNIKYEVINKYYKKRLQNEIP